MAVGDLVRELIPHSLERRVRPVLEPGRAIKKLKKMRLRSQPRYTPCTTTLLDHPTRMVDAASFLSAYRAIFEDEIYAFEPSTEAPVIIDGGANIGLATLYWKKKWPAADITAFEPDPQVFEVFEWNCQRHGYPDVTRIRKGVWSEDTALQFCPDGADAGHVVNHSTTTSGSREEGDKGSVPVVRLARFLDQPIDLLKLDIEGAETEVLLDCEGALGTVDRLFVEYHSYVGQEQRLNELLHVLQEADFRIHIQPEFVAEKPFVQRLENHGMDHRLNIFGYRL